MGGTVRTAPTPQDAPDGAYADGAWLVLEATADDYALGDTVDDVSEDRRLQLEGLEQSDDLGILVSANAERMVQLAAGQVGVAESGGDNQGTPLNRYVRWFTSSSGPQPWCAFFASWCWDRATDSNHNVPWAPGSTQSVYYWGQRVGRLVSTPQRGDFCLKADFTHMGIVERVSGTAMTTVDGNWSDAVRRVSRTHGTAYRYVRLP
jgi:hypothetical protein